jgi:succinate-semialdehyde dehydrogenase / glutarate-semialdehyde dehydrogenase
MTTAASIPAGKVATIDPATGIELAAYVETSDDQVDAILERAYRAGAAWREVPVAERAETVRRLGRALRERGDELARLATAEMGKPLAQSQAEVEKCAAACEWFAEHGPALLAPEAVATEARLSQVRYEPLGVLFAIMPWNFPYWQVIRALAPAVIAGNVVLLKHAPSTTGCALLLEEVAAAATPPDLLTVVVTSVERTPGVSERIIGDDRVAAVTLTGSTGAGRAVAGIAGRALKKTVLELGGSDPFIVLADADIAAAADYAPTVLDQVTADMPVLAEEVFGPAVPLVLARDADHAVELANDTRFGLGSNVWTGEL